MAKYKVKGTKLWLGSAIPVVTAPATESTLAEAVTAASTLFSCDELTDLGDFFALSRDTITDDPTLCDSNDVQLEDTDGGIKIAQFTISGYQDPTSAGQALAMAMISNDNEGTLVIEKTDTQKLWLKIKVVNLSPNDLSNPKVKFAFTVIARSLPKSV